MNKCKKCNKDLLNSFFYKSRLKKGDYICKKCCLIRDNIYYKKNRERRLLKSKEARARSSIETRRKYQINSLIKIKSDPILFTKYKAREKLRGAVRRGKISKERCRVCADIKVEAHHTDYSKPFDVIWLCRKCHRGVHSGELTL